MTDGWAHPVGADGMPLPVPARNRWQPLRAGLVDLFFYDAEEFWFRDGHLLLRGNNGTGKSKVLALLLPFLLDGEVSPHRVEPDGDASKRMEWNLLLGGRYTERIGYTWLELGRVDEDGTPRHLTLGCGLKAVAGRGAPARWFFLTDQRVGVDLWLVNPSGTAKTKDRLAEAIEGRGVLVEQPSSWRRLLDERLFGLGHDRYEALLTMLIQLRQPQLSKRPDEQALSAALTESLPPLDQDIVHGVAEAFRTLESERHDLERVAEAHRAVTGFREQYRRYAGVATRRRAEEVRKAQSSYEATNRRLTTATEELEAAQAAEASARERVRILDADLSRHRATEQALRDSPVMRQAATLDEVRRAAETAETAAREAGERAEGAATDAETAARALAEAERTATGTREALETAAVAAQDAAEPAGVGSALRAALGLLPDADAARTEAGRTVARRDRDVRHLLGLVAEAEAAEAELAGARRRVEDAIATRDRAAERRAEQERAAEDAGAALVDAARTWARGAAELGDAADEAVLGALEGWVVSLDGPNPAVASVNALARSVQGRLADEGAALARRRGDLEEERGTLEEERDALLAGEVAAPPVPHTRADSRADRRGAPLWQVVDFVPGVSDIDRAGVEAALEASGLLDAWLTPEGRLLDPGTLDTIIRADEPAGRSISEVLRPAVDPADPAAATLSATTVTAVLDGIGLGDAAADHPSWVAVDGRWRLGAANGRWTKPAARYIGHAAREAARAERLAELDARLGEIARDLEDLTSALVALDGRRQRVDDEVDTLPGDDALREAVQRLGLLVAEVDRLGDAVAEREAEVDTEIATRDTAARTRDEAATDLHLPADRGGLESVREAVADFRAAVGELWPTAARHGDATRRLEDAGGASAHRSEAAVQARAEAERIAQDAVDARTRHKALHATVGADVAELQRQLTEVGAALEQAAAHRETAEEQRGEQHDAAVRAEAEQRLLAQQLTEATDRRARAAEAFQRFAATGLLAAGVPDVDLPDAGEPWAPDPTVRLARRCDQALEQLDASDAVWDRVQRTVTDQFAALTEALSRHGHQASAELADAGFVVTITYHQQQASPDALVDVLVDDLAQREQLLSARERELLEDHLLADVATHLQELISRADAQLLAVNRELAERPTSTGMRLRLAWLARTDGPAGLDKVRARLLRQTVEAWPEEDRAAVGAFLQAQIAEVRATSEGGTWPEHLAEALDYRRWHRFRVERRQDGEWKAASGPASGGERALVVTLPLFAAASSFYATAGNPHAPRLVLLDEAFAGIDDDARGKCMGLLAEFDLDFVMTSEREWGCYPALPGLGISQLARREGIDAVHVSRWEWDGRARSRVDVALPPLREPAPEVDGASGEGARSDGAQGHGGVADGAPGEAGVADADGGRTPGTLLDGG
jgi:uncharacterized protein (TIGR02680 family)